MVKATAVSLTFLALLGMRGSARAGHGEFVWTVVEEQGSSGAIEQQPGVIYQGECLWTIDSHVLFGGFGKLAAGQSATYQRCLIADGTSRIAGVKITAGSPDLDVTVSYAPQGRMFRLVARPLDRGFEYRGCVIGPRYGDWPSLPEVEGSTGGHGQPTDITVTVTNPTGRTVRDVNASAALSSSTPGYCQSLSEPFEDPAGVVWQTGL